MAFIPPDEETPAQKGAVSQQAPIAAGGAGVGGSTKAASTPGQNLPAQPSAQLSAYLSANQPQAAQFGQDVAGQVSNQINAAGQAIPQAVNTYTGQLYSVPTDASVNSAVETSPSSLTDAQKSIYQNELGAAGKAPNSAGTFETTGGYQDAASKVQGAVDQANLWNSGNNPANISTALAPYESPNATAGVRTLDSLLLSQTPAAYNQIRSAVAPAAGYQAQLASGTKDANAALQAAIAQDQAATTGAQGSAQKFTGNLNNTLAAYLAQAQKDADTYNGQVNQIAGKEALVQPQAASLQDAIAAYNDMVASAQSGNWKPGVPVGDPSIFSDLSPISYGQQGAIPAPAGAPSVSQLGTAQNYSDLAALQALLGDSAFGGLNSAITPATANQAGTYTSPTGNIPTLYDIFGPVASSVGAGVGKNAQFIGNNPTLGEDTILNPFNAVQDSYAALMQAIGQQTPPRYSGPPAVDPTTNTPITSGPGVTIDPTTGIPYDPTTGLPITSNVGGDIFGPTPPQTEGEPIRYRPLGGPEAPAPAPTQEFAPAPAPAPAPEPAPAPTTGTPLVPGTPEYNQYLQALYPGLNIAPAPTTKTSPTRYGVL